MDSYLDRAEGYKSKLCIVTIVFKLKLKYISSICSNTLIERLVEMRSRRQKIRTSQKFFQQN